MNQILEKYCIEEWHELIAYHCDVLTFDPGEVIFNIGDKTKGLLLIDKGKVKVLTSGTSNKERIIRLAADNDILGHRGFGGNWTYSIKAVALTKTMVTFLPLGLFKKLMKTNPEFAYYMTMFFAEELRDSERLAKQMPVKNKVASVILQSYKVFGLNNESDNKLAFTLSRKDIANKAGTTYESVVRVLTDLNKEEVIETKGKDICLKDIIALTKLADGD